MMPDARGVGLDLLELLDSGSVVRTLRVGLGSVIGARRSTARGRCRAAAAVRRTAITSAAAYAASRAAARPAPSAVTFSTRPPAVTIAPSRRAVPAWVTSTPAGSASSPAITSPVDDDSG